MNQEESAVRREFKRQYNYDVVVVGGGTTGIAAAISSARNGAKTAIVECNGFLGGNAATGLAWLGFHGRSGQRVVEGIAQEIIDDLTRVGGATKFYPDPIVGSLIGVNSHWLKVIAAEKVRSAGVDIYLHSLAVDVDAGQVCQTLFPPANGVIIQCREGMLRLNSKVTVDCTDSGRIAELAGATLLRGRKIDGKVQVASWTFQVGGVCFSELISYFTRHPGQLRPFPLQDKELKVLLKQMETAEIFVMGAFKDLIQLAKNDGLTLPRDTLPGTAHRREKVLTLVGTRLEDVNPDDVLNFSAAEIEGAGQVKNWVRFLKCYVPGCKDIFLCGTPHQIGLRETNHIAGEYILTADDLLSGSVFKDSIAAGAYHLDIHSPDHGGIETKFAPVYGIPYRSLIPRGIEGMLVAGRAISATHEAMASTRVIPIGMAMGQSAGVAAAMAASGSGSVRDIDLLQLRRRLLESNVILPDHSGNRDHLS